MPKEPLIGDLIGVSQPTFPFVETGDGGKYDLKLHYRTKTGSGHLTRQFKLTPEAAIDYRNRQGVGNVSFRSIENKDAALSIYVEDNKAISLEIRVLSADRENITECYAAHFSNIKLFINQYPQLAFLFAENNGTES